MAAPFLIVLAMGVLYTSYGELPLVQAVLRGVAAVAAGMMLAMGLKMAMVARIRNVLCIVGIAAFVAVAVLRLPLLAVLLALAPAGVLLAWWWRRGEAA
jgi:chromate transporter